MFQARTAPLPTSACVAMIGIHCYSPGPVRAGVQLGAASPFRGRRLGPDDRDRRLVRVADDRERPARVRSDVREPAGRLGYPADPVIGTDPPADDHPACRLGAAVRSDERRHGRLGAGDDAGRGVGARDRSPRAKILLVETPVSETEGVQGFPEIVQAENFVIDHHLAGVISQSFGATEETFPDAAFAARTPRRIPERGAARRDRARRLRRQRVPRTTS